MELVYQADPSASRADETTARPEYIDPPEASIDGSDNPFAYVTIPPIGRLLECICARLGVGGCFRPGNRQLADWLGYASAGQIPALLSQLACLGWIDYDPATRLIMLRRTYRSDQAIRSIDQFFLTDADDTIADDSALICSTDRDMPLADAEYESDLSDRSNPQRMEDHVLVAAARDSESAAARYKIPCGDETISPADHRAALLSELGTAPSLIARALEKRPGLTTAQIRATWAHFQVGINAGRCTDRAFHAAIARGEIHAAPPDPALPLDPQAYADRPGVMLGGQAPPGETDAESVSDRAARLLPKPTAATIRQHTADWLYLQGWIGEHPGASDDQALAALAERRSAVRR